MKVQKKMIMANVAIQICKEDKALCGDTTDKSCRFLDDKEEVCILFAKPLKVTKPDLAGETSYKRCKPCVEGEPG